MDGSDDILAYVAFLAAGLCDAQEFTPSTWTEVLPPYMTNLFPSKAVANDETLEKFHLAAEKATVGIDDNESYGDADDEGFEEVCNLRFKYVQNRSPEFSLFL